MTSSGLTLRVAQKDDGQAISELLERSYSQLFQGWYEPDLLAILLPVIARANPELLSSGTYYLVEDRDYLVGCGGWSMDWPGSEKRDPKLGHIRHFASHPDYTRRGIGGRILGRCLNDSRSAGLTELLCYSSLTAERFYAQNGFEVIGHQTVMITETIPMPVVVMRRTLFSVSTQ